MGRNPDSRPAGRLVAWKSTVSLLRKCAEPGCGVWTMGELCIEHEKPRQPAPPRRPSASTSHEERPQIRSREFRKRLGPRSMRNRSGFGEGSVPPCRRGDGLFELWLGSCDGFRVIAADEPVGTVVRIVRDGDGQPTSLIVRAAAVPARPPSAACRRGGSNRPRDETHPPRDPCRRTDSHPKPAARRRCVLARRNHSTATR